MVKIRNAAECQAYLHHLIRRVDMHNIKNPDTPQIPNWSKIAEHVDGYSDAINWKDVFEDLHFSPRIRDSLIVRKDNKFVHKYALYYGKYKMDLRNDIANNIDFKSVEKAVKIFNTADWELVAHKPQLFNDLIESGHLNESTLETMTKYFSDEHWNIVASNQDLSETFIERHIEEIPVSAWKNISMYQDMDESFMQKYLDAGKLDSKILSVGQKLSMTFIEKNLDKLDMDGLCQAQTLTEEFIRIMQSVWEQGFIGSCYKFLVYRIWKYAKNNIVPISFLVINFLLLFCWKKPIQCFFHFCVAFFGHVGVIFRSSHYIAVTEPL